MFLDNSKNIVVAKNKCYSTAKFNTYEEAKAAKDDVLASHNQVLTKAKIVKRQDGAYFELKLYKSVNNETIENKSNKG